MPGGRLQCHLIVLKRVVKSGLQAHRVSQFDHLHGSLVIFIKNQSQAFP